MEKRHEQVVAEPMRYVGAILASDLAPQKWPSPSNCFTCWIAIGHDATIHKFPKSLFPVFIGWVCHVPNYGHSLMDWRIPATVINRAERSN
jgi:hypothetical protein